MDLFYGYRQQDTWLLHEGEAQHLRAMRKRSSDHIMLTDGEGHHAICEITEVGRKEVSLAVLEEGFRPNDLTLPVLAVAPTKNISRYEFMVEKLTEIGVREIIPIIGKHSERKHLRLDRLVKHAIAAMKQSQRYWLPAVSEPQDLLSFLSQVSEDHLKLIAACDWQQPTHISQLLEDSRPSIVCIGPEGGFDTEELAFAKMHGWQQVLLGDQRLRTETAAIVSVSMILANRNNALHI